MIRDFFHSFETLFYHMYPVCSEISGRRIDQSSTIMDMTNGSIGSINSQVYSLLKRMAALTSDNYPENMA